MRKNSVFALVLSLVLMVSLLFGGCAGIRENIWDWRKQAASVAETPPQEIFVKAEYYFTEGLFKKAREEFSKIKQFHPLNTEFVMKAEIRIADSYYRSAEYMDAIISYNDFMNLYPNSPEIPYCIYQIANCNYAQVQPFDRDQRYTEEAIKEFGKLLFRFPDSKYTLAARQKIRDCEERLAKRELYVAEFYIKKEKYPAAIARLDYLLATYPHFSQSLSASYLLESIKVIQEQSLQRT
ncbi:MAG: outer membrane protein assembly factor BamD [Deltaproteobacteria bacterium]|nr:outer membrane protein assembly factor BamD [Deltaproteobacteria bacterium]